MSGVNTTSTGTTCTLHGPGWQNPGGCPACQALAAHACPLAPVSADEAIGVMVGLLAKSSSASQVVARLEGMGLRLGRVRR